MPEKMTLPSLEFVIDVFNQKLAEFQGNISNKIHINA